MRNITVSVPEETYRTARIAAAKQNTSVSALVTRYLRSLSDDEAEFARLAALEQTFRSKVGSFRASDRLRRDEVHDRALR